MKLLHYLIGLVALSTSLYGATRYGATGYNLLNDSSQDASDEEVVISLEDASTQKAAYFSSYGTNTISYATTQWKPKDDFCESFIIRNYGNPVLGIAESRDSKVTSAITSKDSGIAVQINDSLSSRRLPLEKAIPLAIRIIQRSLSEDHSIAEKRFCFSAISLNNDTVNISNFGTTQGIPFSAKGEIIKGETREEGGCVSKNIIAEEPIYVFMASSNFWHALSNAEKHMREVLGRKAPIDTVSLAHEYAINFIREELTKPFPKGISQTDAFKAVLGNLCVHTASLTDEDPQTFSLMLAYVAPQKSRTSHAPRTGLFGWLAH